jgi:glyoxylase-like metal-dependent hydrolase (beta-lactamase superfamily II)
MTLHRHPWFIATLVSVSLSSIAVGQSALGAWQSGGASEPTLRVRALAHGMWAIRQGKRSNAEAPFMYLIAGTRRALLLDTGADPTDGTPVPLVETVDSLLATLRPARIDSLIVLHSHAHSDHRAHDGAFAARRRTWVIPADTASVMRALALPTWPSVPGRLDLGGRALDILPTPGHERAHLMIYDARTRFLFGGDMLYPGLLTVRDLQAFRASVSRLMAFAASHPIRAVLGAHVEMSATRGLLYPLGSTVQPDEHVLALPGASVRTLARMVDEAGDFVGTLFDDAIALARVRPASSDRSATHGMLLFGRERLYFSHLPMARSPHDYQLIFEGRLPDSTLALYRADAAQHDTTVFTIEPTEQWVLPHAVQHDTTFLAHVYRGHFERGGVRIASSVPIRVARVVMFRRFESGDAPAANDWISVGSSGDRYLLHRIAGRNDVDQVLHLCPGRRTMRVGARVRVTRARVGAETAAGRICRVVYEERGDLAAP